MKIGDIVLKAGFVTRQFNLQGRSLSEIEDRLGYHRGRLSRGAYFLAAIELPTIHGFNFAGYTHVPGHHTDRYGDINNPEDHTLALKQKMDSVWGLSGIDRLVKVIPVMKHNDAMAEDEQYPPGNGIQQWKITSPIKFQVEELVLNYPLGRYIPREGYREVRYK